MIPADIKVLKKVIKTSLTQGNRPLSDSHEKIVSHTIYNLAIHDVLELLEGIENGTIDKHTINQILNKEDDNGERN